MPGSTGLDMLQLGSQMPVKLCNPQGRRCGANAAGEVCVCSQTDQPPYPHPIGYQRASSSTSYGGRLLSWQNLHSEERGMPGILIGHDSLFLTIIRCYVIMKSLYSDK